MIQPLNSPLDAKHCGNKAAALSILLEQGFPVPQGLVLDKTLWCEILRHNNLQGRLTAVLAEPNLPVQLRFTQIQQLLQDIQWPPELEGQLARLLKPDTPYAVRSSGLQEDLPGFSFAGQYTTILNAAGLQQIKQAVLTCCRSAYSKEVLSYLEHSGLAFSSIEIAVIVQEMVPADKSGVVFSLNPITGKDTEMLVEAAEGLGTNVVDGHAKTQQYRYNWYSGYHAPLPEQSVLTPQELETLCETCFRIVLHFGFPCDIEFSFSQGKLYILQARAITQISYTALQDIWTTADFRDGGVSSTVCYPFMWSLYEYAWETSFREFLLSSRLLPKSSLRKLGRMFYGRPYWNLSVAKDALSRVIGYKEKEFDTEYGIASSYTGEGKTTKATPKSLFHITKVAVAQKRILAKRNAEKETLQAGLLAKHREYAANLQHKRNRQEWEQVWKNLVLKDYLHSEGTYFMQIFINTVHQALFKSTVLKYVSPSEYFTLIGGLEQISHLRPFYDQWEITRRIRKDITACAWWMDHSADEIAREAMQGARLHHLDEFSSYLQKYGYHSEKELDITFPCYEEVPERVAELFKKTLEIEDSCAPSLDIQRQKQTYALLLKKLKIKNSPLKYKRLLQKIEQMREMLWWREEFRDTSTRFYHIVRLYTLRLAKEYCAAGILQRPEDIWYLKIQEIVRYINGELTAEDLRKIVQRSRRYYTAYRNYTSGNEIGHNYVSAAPKSAAAGTLQGVGCSNGDVTGIARVVQRLEDINFLQEGDILITRFTDTGWTSSFALLKGVVTEYGGALCHAAIVSREYGIPCIVCVKDAVKLIPDGSRIHVNGVSGLITILK